jgi:hypothetical protein
MSQSHCAFLEALRAGKVAADRAGNMDLYGWLIGSADRCHAPPAGRHNTAPAE